MKLVSLHIHSFGKLQDVDVNFQSGLNVFTAENGFGKTTTASFVRAMLYGFKKNSRTQKYDAQNASSWANWTGTQQTGGNLVVENNGETYRIERFFGATAKGDSLNVVNVKTGKQLVLPQGVSVGEYFLGLTADSYDRSVYFPQEAVEMQSNENLNRRLAGLVENVTFGYEKVQSNLKEFQSKLASNRRDHAEIPDLEKEKYDLLHAIAQRQQAQCDKQSADARLKEIDEEKSTVANQLVLVEKEILSLHKQQARFALSEQQIQSQKYADTLRAKLAKAEGLEQDKKTLDELAKKIESTPEIAKKQRRVSLPLLISGLVLLAVGVGVIFAQLIAGVCVAAVGALLAVISPFVKPGLKTLPAGEKDAYISQYFQLASNYVFTDGMDFSELKKALWETYTDYVATKREYAAICASLPTENIDAETVERLQQATEVQRQLQQKQLSLTNESGRLQATRQSLNCDTVDLREKLSEVEQKLATAHHTLMVSEKVVELLTKAKENLSTSYLPKLYNRCGQLMSQITGEKFDFQLDGDFQISLQVGGISKSLDSFSRGQREIALLCFRIALSELLFDTSIPLVIVDDAFVNFDEDNFLRATELLKKIATNGTQVVYFTCHRRLGNLAK